MRYYIKENESLPGIANLSVKQTETGDDCAAMLMAQGGNIKEILQRIHHHIDKNPRQPLLLKLDYQEPEKELFLLSASAELSLLLLIGYGNAFWLTNRGIAHADIVFGILQATGLRISGTEYISCPGCGRTTFDLQNTLKNIKEHTRGMKNTRIAVMGCIVNGPGEMAGADYGYVGEGNGKVSLYHKGKRLKMNIPEEDAIKELLSIIKKERAD
jgi:(E)-4-hydroxy-3-methylbut-2-enyl-diphosphate synthase